MNGAARSRPVKGAALLPALQPNSDANPVSPLDTAPFVLEISMREAVVPIRELLSEAFGRGVLDVPRDLVDEGALERALARRGLTEPQLARQLGLTAVGWNTKLGFGAPGFRERLERALGLEPGKLKLKRSDD